MSNTNLKRYPFAEAIEKLKTLPCNGKNFAYRIDKEHDSDYRITLGRDVEGVIYSTNGNKFILAANDFAHDWVVVDHESNKDIIIMEKWLVKVFKTGLHTVVHVEGKNKTPDSKYMRVKLLKTYEINLIDSKEEEKEE